MSDFRTRVGAHLRKNGSAVKTHMRKLPMRKRAASTNKPVTSAACLVESDTTGTFPDPRYIPVRKPTRRWRKPRANYETYEETLHGFTSTYFVKREDGPDGTGKMVTVASQLGSRVSGLKQVVDFGPDMMVHAGIVRLCDYSLTNLPGAKFYVHGFRHSTFAGANLQNAKLGMYACLFEDVSFEGADLAGAFILGATLKNVSFRGANLTGAEITSSSRFKEMDVDFTDSNLTGEQFDLLAKDRYYEPGSVKMSRYSIEEAASLLGDDGDAFVTLVWLGEIEYRSKATDEKVDDAPFDAEQHYIPQWAMQQYKA
jgi:hypothetical protein